MLFVQKVLSLLLLPPLLLHLHLQVVRHRVEELRPAHQVLIGNHLVEIILVLFNLRILKLPLLLGPAHLYAEPHFGKLVHRNLGLLLNFALCRVEGCVHGVVAVVELVALACSRLRQLSCLGLLLAHSFDGGVRGPQSRVSPVVEVQLVVLHLLFHQGLPEAGSRERPHRQVVRRRRTQAAQLRQGALVAVVYADAIDFVLDVSEGLSSDSV